MTARQYYPHFTKRTKHYKWPLVTIIKYPSIMWLAKQPLWSGPTHDPFRFNIIRQCSPKLLRLLGKGFFRLLAEDGSELRDDALKLQFP